MKVRIEREDGAIEVTFPDEASPERVIAIIDAFLAKPQQQPQPISIPNPVPFPWGPNTGWKETTIADLRDYRVWHSDIIPVVCLYE